MSGGSQAKQSAGEQAAIGMVAGVVAEFATLPIYAVKNVMETSRKPLGEALKSMINEGGARGFLNGWPWALARQGVSTAARYGLYQELKRITEENVKGPAWAVRFASGAASGIVVAAITHPLDTICITQQRRSENAEHPSVAQRSAAEGRGFVFKGLQYAALRNFLVGALVFPLNETVRDFAAWPGTKLDGQSLKRVWKFGWLSEWRREEQARAEKYSVHYKVDEFPPGAVRVPNALTPVVASFFATLVIQPVDFVKTRRSQNLPIFVGWNPRSYYRGLSMNLLRVIPHFFIVMAVVDKLTELSK